MKTWIWIAAAVVVVGMVALVACKSTKIEAPIYDDFEALPSATPVKVEAGQENHLRVGQTIVFNATVHGSVGLDFELNYDKEFFDCKYKSEWANPSKKDMPGGDRQEVTYTLTAKKAGTTTITSYELWRGTKRDEKVYTIVIR
ncbi:MAG: hypothetical protein J6X70_08080 [Muribaculaceae bacterium]|nr:hypothetical protein [Muribaculaceae bacterium]